jgi:hypothetical protein
LLCSGALIDLHDGTFARDGDYLSQAAFERAGDHAQARPLACTLPVPISGCNHLIIEAFGDSLSHFLFSFISKRLNTLKCQWGQAVNFEAVAKETFQVLRSYEYEVVLYDDDGNQVFEPNEARRLFAKPENLLISIVDDGEDSSVRCYLSKSTDVESVMGLIDALRSMATKYNMTFHVRKYERVLSPKDFSTRASVTEHKRTEMKIVEHLYGTSRSSYLKLENARMVIRHSERLNEKIEDTTGFDAMGSASDADFSSSFDDQATDMAYDDSFDGDYGSDGGVDESAEKSSKTPKKGDDQPYKDRPLDHMRPDHDWSDEDMESAEEKKAAKKRHSVFDSFNPGVRGENIATIHVEDADGERYQMPTNDFSAGRAMTHHINNGGHWTDSVGEQISRITVEFGKLNTASRYIYNYGGHLGESAHLARRTIREHMSSIRRLLEGLASSRYSEAAELIGSRPVVEASKAKIKETATLLKSAGRLPADVVNAVAVVLEMGSTYTAPKLPSERGLEFVGVLGRKVNKAAWDALKAGHLDLLSPLDTTKAPNFSNSMAAYNFALRAVAEKCKDDSVANLLGFIASERGMVSGQEAQKMDRVAQAVFQAARKSSGHTLGDVAATESVMEFQSWLHGFTPSQLLSEIARFQEPKHDARPEQELNGVLGQFDYHEFMASPSAENYNNANIAHLTDEDAEKHVTSEEVVNSLYHYLNDLMDDGQGAGDVDCTEDAQHLLKTVVGPKMTSEGYIFDDGATFEGMTEDCGHCEGDHTLEGVQDMEEAELTREDMLLPKDEEKDFKDEVTSKHDDDYIGRLTSLAGVRR